MKERTEKKRMGDWWRRVFSAAGGLVFLGWFFGAPAALRAERLTRDDVTFGGSQSSQTGGLQWKLNGSVGIADTPLSSQTGILFRAGLQENIYYPRRPGLAGAPVPSSTTVSVPWMVPGGGALGLTPVPGYEVWYSSLSALTEADFTAAPRVLRGQLTGAAVDDPGAALLPDLQYNTTYYFAVTALDGTGLKDRSDPLILSTCTLAPTPDRFALYWDLDLISRSVVRVSFQSNNFLGHDLFYRAQISNIDTGDPVDTVMVSLSTSSTNKVTLPDIDVSGIGGSLATYSLKLWVRNRMGVESEYTPYETLVFPTGIPEIQTATVNISSVTLTWNRDDAFGASVTAQASSDNFVAHVISIPLPATIAQYTFVNLLSNTTYWFRLSVAKGVSTPWRRVTGVYRPTNVSVPGVFISSATFSWVYPTVSGNPASRYEVEVSSRTNWIPAKRFSATSSPTTLPVDFLVPNTTYFARVYSFNSDDVASIQGPSATVVFVTKPSPATSVRVLNATFPTHRVRMAWTDTQNNPDTTTYQLRLSTSLTLTASVPSTITVLGALKDFEFANTTPPIEANRQYYAWVRALWAGNPSLNASAYIRTSTITAVIPPQNLTVTPSTGSIAMTWRDFTYMEGGRVLVANSSTTLYALNNTGQTVTGDGTVSAEINYLNPNTTYPLSVTAVAIGPINGRWPDQTVSTEALTLAEAPAISSVNWGDTSVTMVWDQKNNPPGTRYVVNLYLGAGAFGVPFRGPIYVTSVNSHSFTDLTSNTEFTVSVAAVNHAGVETELDSQTGNTVSGTPVNVRMNAVDPDKTRNLLLEWDRGTNPVGTDFIPSISTHPSFPIAITRVAPLTEGIQQLFGGLVPNTTYYGRVAAQDQNGVLAYSNTVSSFTYPATPSGLNDLFIGTSSATWVWSANGNRAGTLYRVFLATVSTFIPETAPLLTTNTSAFFTGLTANKQYFIKVVAVGGGDLIAVSTTSSFYTLPAIPANLRAVAVTPGRERDSVAFTWGHNGNNPETTRYRVQVATNPQFSSSLTTTTALGVLGIEVLNQPEYPILANQIYFARAQTVTADPGPDALDSEFSAIASTGTAPLAPQDLAFTPFPFAVEVNWVNSSGSILNAEGTEYAVQARSEEAGDLVFSSTAALPFASVGGLTPNTTYVFTVTTLSNYGWPSVAVLGVVASSVTKPILEPEGIFYLSVYVSSVTINWNRNNSNVNTPYQVELFHGGVLVSSHVVLSTFTAFDGLTSNRVHYASVTAIGHNGQNETAASSFYTRLATPLITSFVGKSSSPFGLTMDWDSNGNDAATSYEAAISKTENGGKETTGFNISNTATFDSFEGNPLLPNAIYYFNVTAQPDADAPPVISTSVSLTTFTYTRAQIPQKPVSVTANDVTKTSFKISLGTNPVDTEYAIYITSTSSSTVSSFHEKYFKLAEDIRFGNSLVIGTTSVHDSPDWHPLGDWQDYLADPFYILTSTTVPLGVYNVQLVARNKLHQPTDFGEAGELRKIAGPPSLSLTTHEGVFSAAMSRASPIYTNQFTNIPFRVQGSPHYNIIFSTADIEELNPTGVPAYGGTYGWNGDIQVTDPPNLYPCPVLYPDNLDRLWESAYRGFCPSGEDVWYLHIAGNVLTYSTDGIPNGFESDYFLGTPFRVFIDTTPPDPGVVRAYFDDTKDLEIQPGQTVADYVPYFEWPGVNDLGAASSRSPILGYSYSVSVDPAVVPETSTTTHWIPVVEGSPPGLVVKMVDLGVSLEVGCTFYVKVMGLDKANNWTLDPSSFTYRYTPDFIAPQVVGLDISGVRYPDGLQFAAADPAGSLVVWFSEKMSIRSGAIWLVKLMDGEGIPLVVASSVPLTYVEGTPDNEGYPYTFTPTTPLEQGALYRFYSTSDLADSGGNRAVSGFDVRIRMALDASLPVTVVSEDRKAVIEMPAGAAGTGLAGVAVNDTPEDFGVGPVGTLSSLVTNANGAMNGQAGGYRRVFVAKEFNLFRPDGTLISEPFNAPVKLAFPFGHLDQDEDGIVDQTAGQRPIRVTDLAIHKLNERTGVWEKMPDSQWDAARREVWVNLRHFSTYALVGSPNYDLSEAHPYPVPYRAARDPNGITFTGLSSFGTIKIYSMDGRLVKTLNFDGVSSVPWDPVSTDGGSPVGSDVYLYVIENDQQRRVGKLMVIR